MEQNVTGFFAPHSLLRDRTISPACRWMVLYIFSLMSEGPFKENNIKIAPIIEHLKGKMGRHVVYKLVEEAIKSGYLTRERFLEKNLARFRYTMELERFLPRHTE